MEVGGDAMGMVSPRGCWNAGFLTPTFTSNHQVINNNISNLVSQKVLKVLTPGPAAKTPSRNLLEMPVFRLHPRPVLYETLGVNPAFYIHKPTRQFWQRMKNYWHSGPKAQIADQTHVDLNPDSRLKCLYDWEVWLSPGDLRWWQGWKEVLIE